MKFSHVESIHPTKMFESIRNEDFCKNMFFTFPICLKRSAKWNIFFFISTINTKLPYLVLLEKIIPVVFLTNAKRLVLNWLLDSSTMLLKKTQFFFKKASGSEISATRCMLFSLRCIPGHKGFLLRPSMDPGLSNQVLVADFCQQQGWGRGLLSQFTCEFCGQPLPVKKNTQDSEWNLNSHV